MRQVLESSMSLTVMAHCVVGLAAVLVVTGCHLSPKRERPSMGTLPSQDFHGSDADVAELGDAGDIGDEADEPTDAEFIETGDTDDRPIGPWNVELVTSLDDSGGETEIVVANDGTQWLAYHTCVSERCRERALMLARRPIGGDWSIEQVAEAQVYDFALSLDADQRPMLSYVDGDEWTLFVANPNSDGTFEMTPLDTRCGSNGDVVRTLSSRTHRYVLHSNGLREDPIVLYRSDENSWSRVTTLDFSSAGVAPDGLTEDAEGWLWMTYRTIDELAVVAYEPATDTWRGPWIIGPRDGFWLSSVEVMGDMSVCVSGARDNRLVVLCAAGPEPTSWVEETVPDQQVFGFNRLIQTDNGAAVVAFDHWSHEELRVVWRAPRATSWSLETVAATPGYGISMTTTPDGLPVISFLTCDDQGCAVAVATRLHDDPPD